MKKLLLTTALVGVAFVAAPANAEVSLGLGGHMKGYVTWHDQDDLADWDDANDDGVFDAGELTSMEARTFDMIRETEIHFTGETTLDNGLTVGFHAEAEADGGDGFEVEESYAYFAGNWGRVNFGAEDGAAYLLQVAAPAADTNIDGIRQYIDPVRPGYQWEDANNDGVVDPAEVGNFVTGPLDYAQDDTGYSDKITYISPVFNGFQAAASYTFDAGEGYANSFGVRSDDVEDAFGDAWEGAVRYEGQFNAVRLAIGAGYTHLDVEEDAVAGGGEDQSSWNVGLNLGFGPFNVGGAYSESNDIGGTDNLERETWVLGVDYTTGPFVIGASYLNAELDLPGVAGEDEAERYSAGVTYTYGPGMTFRGSVHHAEYDADGAGFEDDATSLLLGTQIGF